MVNGIDPSVIYYGPKFIGDYGDVEAAHLFLQVFLTHEVSRLEPLTLIYWLKVALGVVAAVLCVLLPVANLFGGIGIGVLTYVVSDRVLRRMFINEIDKPSTVTKTGIGIFIIAWVFFWVLLFTLINPPIPLSV